jgi:hypothetical protein
MNQQQVLSPPADVSGETVCVRFTVIDNVVNMQLWRGDKQLIKGYLMDIGEHYPLGPILRDIKQST